MEQLDLRIFDLSPIPMWIQDYSGVKKIFEQWTAQGIVDIRSYLLKYPNRMLPCLATIKTLNINQSTLKLYEANNLEEILANFEKFHFEEITIPQVHFFTGLWEQISDCVFAPINYTCTGKQIDVQLKANIIPGYEQSWERILLTTEDITPYQNARRYAESIFTYSPTSLWINDFSKIKKRFNTLRKNNILDLKQFLTDHPEYLQQCFDEITIIDINHSALKLFKARNKTEFLDNMHQIFSIYDHQTFTEKLLKLWDDNYDQQHECTYYTIDGQTIHVVEQFNIFPQNKNDWRLTQVALTDITERKFMESHLEFLGKHDILTKLYNRTFFNEEVSRLAKNSIHPISCIYLDVNGLKAINDRFGHSAGDQLLERLGKILSKITENTEYSVSRIGGDEFVVLMPQAGKEQVQHIVQLLNQHIIDDNQINKSSPISVSMGHSTIQSNEKIEDLIRRADQTMYDEKHKYYQLNTHPALN